jgi:YHS domain-containing protein
VFPILLIYRKYYGLKVAALIAGIMLGTIVLAALAVDAIFDLGGLIPKTRPDVNSITSRGTEWNYTTFLNIVFLGIAAALIGLTLRRGARDPVCGMTVDRSKTQFRSDWGGKTYYFCGAGCKKRFDAEPESFAKASRPWEHAHQH